MVSKFKPLEQIEDDNFINFGDLIMLKTFDESSSIKHWDRPVYYGMIDTYISDGNSGFKKGRKFRGLRVFHYRRKDDSYGIFGSDTVFHDDRKGLLLPFNYGNKCKYALLIKSEDLPK